MTASEIIERLAHLKRIGLAYSVEQDVLANEVVRLRQGLADLAEKWLDRDNSHHVGPDLEWSDAEREAYRKGLDARDVQCSMELRLLLEGK